jgi:hypothetical protein
MSPIAPIRRRLFLQTLVGLGLFFSVATGLPYAYRRSLYRRYLQLRLDDHSAKGVLSQEELQVIQAVFEVVAPQPAPTEAELCAFINWRTSTAKGYCQEYTRAVQLLEYKAQRHFGVGFAMLSRESRERILQAMLPRHTFFPLQEALPIQALEPPPHGKAPGGLRTAFIQR